MSRPVPRSAQRLLALLRRLPRTKNPTASRKSDGTEAGTVLVADINRRSKSSFHCPADSSCPEELTAIGDTLFFSADDGKKGLELWKAPPPM